MATTKSSPQNGDENQQEIGSLKEYLDAISKYEGYAYVYRGLSSKKYDLIPSLGRDEKKMINETQMFLDFKRNYYPYTDVRLSSDIDLLCLAQHYGLPTRLMDWTTNPLIALFFACQKTHNEESPEGKVCVKKLAKTNLVNGMTTPVTNWQEIKDLFPKYIGDNAEGGFIFPENIDIRFRNQCGLFFCCNKPEIPISQDGELVISASQKEAILKELAQIGITKLFIYPLLDNLCDSIKNKNK